MEREEKCIIQREVYAIQEINKVGRKRFQHLFQLFLQLCWTLYNSVELCRKMGAQKASSFKTTLTFNNYTDSLLNEYLMKRTRESGFFSAQIMQRNIPKH